MAKTEFTPVIGIEVHVEPRTKTKMFCDCSADHFKAEPNSQVCPVCLGLPGALPVPNESALKQLVKLGKALGCRVSKESYFERKSYFYPDLPKGYQISQYRVPLCTRGELKIKDQKEKCKIAASKTIRINRAHMEEDTAKLKHRGDKTLVDFNRSGVPLIEIVSEADIRSASEAKEYLKELARLIRWLDISDASMEKGTMRLEANVSLQEKGKFKVAKSAVSPIGQQKLNPRVELKNINSFKFVEKAINYEINRQKAAIESGKSLQQETRGWDEKKGQSFVQRVKEESDDYRYFPEPDIPPIKFSAVSSQQSAKRIQRELPWEAEERLLKDHQLSYQYISVLTASKEKLDCFDSSIKMAGGNLDPKLIARAHVNRKFDPSEKEAQDIVARLSMYQNDIGTDQQTIEKAVRKVIKENKKVVDTYKSGKESAINSLIGRTMHELMGRGDARLVAKKLRELLT